jgi:transcriptional regulator with XRE-family HTH domain
MPWLPSLKRVRESQFLTQQMLADRSGVSQVTIARLESSRRGQKAQFSTIHKLAKALKVSPAELAAFPPDEPQS